ncbi:MAG TPA: nucleoside triphosphate pyrophosphohydrolase [Myxococcales bacterium]|nr:nucleoside triphosphate pyrophosphohydrolase [Myxococcales bacterium]
MSERSAGEAMDRLVEVMRRLRAQDGCPWDREQDLRSLRPYLLEEAHEVLDEMDRAGYGRGSWAELGAELGDLLFQIVFHSQLATELGEFRFADVADGIADKLERRHPHVFGERKVSGTVQVLENWARLKAAEKVAKHGHEGSVLDGVPTSAPALMRAERLTEKASRIGFDWPSLEDVRNKLDEELAELDQAIARGDRDELEHELGDALFSLCNLARFIKTPPEDALRQANRRFTERFHQIEAALRAEGVPFGQATLEQMDRHWEAAKARERSVPPPRHPPRAPLSALEVPVADVALAGRAMDAFGAAVGWSRDLRTGAYEDGGGTRLKLVPGQGGPPVALGFEAPSPRALEAVAEALRAAGIEVKGEPRRVEATAGGLTLRYALPGDP